LLHAAVAELGDIEIALRAERHVVGVAELARPVSLAAPGAHQLAVPGEDLDAMVAGVGHVEVAVRTQSQRADAGELPRLGAARAPALDDLAVAIKLRDSLDFAELGHVEKAVGILHGVADVTELAFALARLAADLA